MLDADWRYGLPGRKAVSALALTEKLKQRVPLKQPSYRIQTPSDSIPDVSTAVSNDKRRYRQ